MQKSLVWIPTLCGGDGQFLMVEEPEILERWGTSGKEEGGPFRRHE